MAPSSKTPAVRRDLAIPAFRLYEDEEKVPVAEDADFIHIETISARAGLHNWEIRPHRHLDLHQFLFLSEGGGRLTSDGAAHVLLPPALVVLPMSLVHGFAFDPSTAGFVLTVSNRFLRRTIERTAEPFPVAFRGHVWSLKTDHELKTLVAAFETLSGELSWSRWGRTRVAAACLELILVVAGRCLARDAAEQQRPDGAHALAERFRSLVQVEDVRRGALPIYARALGVSVDQLSRACRGAAGRSPLQLLHDNLMDEAKRRLLYTCMSVQEVGYSLDFKDPAYFTRFFTRRVGCSPSAFRRRAQADLHRSG